MDEVFLSRLILVRNILLKNKYMRKITTTLFVRFNLKSLVISAIFLHSLLFVLNTKAFSQTIKSNDTEIDFSGILINKENRSLSLPCKVNMTAGLIEVILCRPEGKTHESFLVTDIKPVALNAALLLLGLDPVNEMPEDPTMEDPLSPYSTIETPGDSILIFIEYELKGQIIKKPLNEFIYDVRKKKPIDRLSWLYRGAVTHKSGYIIIDEDVTMIATYHDPVAFIEMNNDDKNNDEWFYVNEKIGLAKDQPVNLIIETIK